MNANALQKIFAWVVVGVCAGGIAWAAEAEPPAKPPPTPEVPANPFGPKPATPADSAPATGVSTMTPASTGSAEGESFVPAVREMLLQRFDKNKDGKLDNTELAEAYALFAGGGGARAGTPEGAYANGPLFGLRGLILRHFGKPPNETLDAAEIVELHAFLFGAKTEAPKPGAELDALRQQIVKQFDKKGTGHLDEAELAAAKTFLQQMLTDLDKYGGEKPDASKNASPSPANATNSPAGTTSSK